MNIPDKAVEAVVAHFKEAHRVWPHEGVSTGDWESNPIGNLREVIDEVLEAAAPFIAAQALREQRFVIYAEAMPFATNGYGRGMVAATKILDARIHDLDPL